MIEYGPADIERKFKEKNASIWNAKRGAGYWIWKPYIIDKTLNQLKQNDYLLYMDAGAYLKEDVRWFIDAMEGGGENRHYGFRPSVFGKAFYETGCVYPDELRYA